MKDLLDDPEVRRFVEEAFANLHPGKTVEYASRRTRLAWRARMAVQRVKCSLGLHDWIDAVEYDRDTGSTRFAGVVCTGCNRRSG